MRSTTIRPAQMTEYSQANMAFHKAIIRLGGVALMSGLTDTLFIHMRAVRAVTMTQDNRAQRSIVDHRNIIAALEAHDADRAERLVREHTHGACGACREVRRFPRCRRVIAGTAALLAMTERGASRNDRD